ncbi:hypothetical protein K505DRAFT_156223 [Melanomma pulvis-pyrius CBS 109.77]|uniref:DUF1772-domain-containing protein n=1 Tax=Melanomma pulvis-pyrius CBS 109.77 TaxID=1314802 RepID=A0A6A6WPY9_9PLEO|nr:hypothetical protein K505DRAFT_156223 [Melanomma pulvis-pyrius CBS 109.77]
MAALPAAEKLTPALQTFSVLAATLAAGINLGTSIVTLPVLLTTPPSAIAVQWQILYDSGIAPVVSLAMSSAVGFATLAYRATPSMDAVGVASHTKRNLYIAAAAAAFGLAPYTQILMLATNKELMRRAKAGDKGQKGDTHELVKTWGRWNFWRGTMVLVGAGLGLWASVN